MAAARQEYTDDLDHGSGSITINEIGNPVKMVLMGEVGGWHYAASNNPNPNSTMWHKPKSPMYSFSFVDGHVKNMTTEMDWALPVLQMKSSFETLIEN